MSQGEWTFLSNYGHVLVSLARDPDARMRDVSEAVGITERAVQQIVRELVGQGYLRKTKVGRRNSYEVVRAAHLRHELESQVTLDDFLELLAKGAAPAGRLPQS
ncbi:winged helix-turn-helix transcriptional regulator [Nocardioides sp.]|uniref:winged helix-turn-helix transcriptional regulator n=1 Tax=Nocardioides sp. TaxID=35761 RepID=UPI00286DE53B|nr:MarR family transcriptional regulator [Nocardioides sp.]